MSAVAGGWDMTALLPELAALPPGLVLDGELVAWRDSHPYFPDVPSRDLESGQHDPPATGRRTIPRP